MPIPGAPSSAVPLRRSWSATSTATTTSARAVTGPADIWVRLPDIDYWER
ncbi:MULTISPECIES: hypothetical protein [unclassified Kitasatospora]